MKNIKHYISYAVLIAAVIFLGFKLFDTSNKLSEKEKFDKKVKNQIQTEAKEIERKVNTEGIESVLFDITGNKILPEQISSAQTSKDIIDTTALALDISTKQLKQVLAINGTLAMENIQLKTKLNALNRPYYTYSGGGLDLTFTPPSGLNADTLATASFTANVGLTATQYWKRNWFLGAKKSIANYLKWN